MRNALFVIGAILVALGVLASAGVLKYQDKDTVADLGRVEIEASREKQTPVNWGYLAIAGGALLLVGGAMTRRRN
jgi:hypothetical protein